jgi:hypothetical protein
MATAESVKAKIQGLIDQSNEATGKTDPDLTSAVGSLISGYGQGGGPSGGASGIYMAKITPATNTNEMSINHNLGTTDILLVAVWAETLGDITPSVNITVAKFWAKTSIPTQRGGNGFSPGYGWNVANDYANPAAPNMAGYETLTITDKNNVSLNRVASGSAYMYLAGVTYNAVVIAANSEV